jgi:hypothetical protein
MNKALLLVFFLSWGTNVPLGKAQDLAQQPAKPEKSRCHVFIDYQFIWTLEMVQGESEAAIPVVNIVTFTKGQWDLRPEQVHLFADRRREAKIKRFSIDTGVAGEPYVVQYMKVLGESFIGIDLIGEFQGFEELSKVYFDLGDNRFLLEPIDCFQYETLVGKINQVNFDSPDLRQDYSVLKVSLYGKREARRRHY